MDVPSRKLLQPGEFFVTGREMILETLLGSCVAVCLFNKRGKLAGMNHFLLDILRGDDTRKIGHYGSSSTEHIIEQMLAKDPVKGRIKAQIFGGGAVLKGAKGDFEVGRRNVEIARQVLGAYGIPISREETGGQRGRRIRFDTSTGEVECRFTGDIPRKRAIQREP